MNSRNRGLCVSQLVQSLRATDADEPIGGQRFRYTLTPEAQNNPNFTLTDNHGKCLTPCQSPSLLFGYSPCVSVSLSVYQPVVCVPHDLSHSACLFLTLLDNSARVLTRRSAWVPPSVYRLPIIVSDGGQPVQSSTYTLTIRVCECDADGDVSSCRNAEPHTLPANLSTAALTTMLICGSLVLGIDY